MNLVRRIRLTGILSVACLAMLAVGAFGQGRYANVYSRSQVDGFISQLEQSSDAFRTDFRNAVNRSNLSFSTKRDYNRDAEQFENAVDVLRRRFNSSNSWWESRNDVQTMISNSQELNSTMNNATFRRNLERQWNRLRNDINKLADTYDLPGLNGGGWNGGPVGPGFPGPGGPGFPSGGGRGTATWSGRVDNIVQLVVQGNNLRAQDLTNSGMQTTSQNMNGSLPRRQVTVTANKFGGRGTVRVAQQPNRSNGFTAIVEISDPRGGADNYRVGINWESGGGFGREEPYQSGRIEWRGRVDNMVNVFIAGSSVTNETVAGSPLVGENFTINGSLAARPGSVRVRKLEGRGTVQVIQQPSRDNDFTAIVRIFDDDGGPDNYRLEITW